MYPLISYKEIKEKMKADEYIIIDVRTPEEFENETIPGSINKIGRASCRERV